MYRDNSTPNLEAMLGLLTGTEPPIPVPDYQQATASAARSRAGADSAAIRYQGTELTRNTMRAAVVAAEEPPG